MAETETLLDHNQLTDVTMGDRDLMREILAALLDDTGHQLSLIAAAITDANRDTCARLAHYSKGACANVGAVSAAALLRRIEDSARKGEFSDCGESLGLLSTELDRLKSAADKI